MEHMATRISSSSPRETRRIGALLAKTIPKRLGAKPFVIALHGELGSGKTTFVQGFARGLGVQHPVTSPTFLIVRHHTAHRGHINHFFHIDAYRIKNRKEVATIGIREIFSTPRSVVVIEWPEHLHIKLPRGTIRAEFHHGSHERERILRVPSFL